MTEELKPCPFCGGEAEPFNPFGKIDGTWTVLCGKCASSVGFEQTEAEAIEAWNTRAERTCRIEGSYLNDFTSNYECWYEFEMECGYEFTWDEMEPPKCCPNCGARVIGMKTGSDSE